MLHARSQVALLQVNRCLQTTPTCMHLCTLDALVSGSARRMARWQAPSQSARAAGRRRLVVHAWGEPVDFSTAKVLSNKPVFAGMHQVVLDVGAELSSGYTKPGQYIQAKVTDDAKPGFFAIASAPAKASSVELLIKTQPGATAEDINKLGAGGSVMVSPVQGKGFPVDKIPSGQFDTVLMFATGSGISPIKAVLDSGVLGKRKHVQLFYGTRTPDETAYQESIKTWTSGDVKVTQVFSSDNKQYVQDELQKQLASGLLTTGSESKVGVLLCGHKDMCVKVTELLTAVGVPKESILSNF